LSAIENLLNRLAKVKGRNGSWTACCPAHDDKGPSLAIRHVDDGRILLHCFAGCQVESVLAAVGMDFGDLFPPDEKRRNYPTEGKPRVKPAFYASDLIRILAFEALVVSICAHDTRKGKKLSDDDYERLKVAQQRIEEVMHYASI